MNECNNQHPEQPTPTPQSALQNSNIVQLSVTQDFILWLIEKLEGVQGFVTFDNAIAAQLKNVPGLIIKQDEGNKVTRVYTLRSWAQSAERQKEMRIESEKERLANNVTVNVTVNVYDINIITNATNELANQLRRLKTLKQAKYAPDSKEMVNCLHWINHYKKVLDRVNNI